MIHYSLLDSEAAYVETVVASLRKLMPDLSEERERDVRYRALNLIRSARVLLDATLSAEIVYEDILDAEIVGATPERDAYDYWFGQCFSAYRDCGWKGRHPDPSHHSPK